MDDLPFQTLHCHTIASDGLLSHEQVLDECLKNNIGVVAFTDHDIIPEPEEVEKLKALNHQVKFISGIEISCDYIPERGDLSSLHVVGLFVDITDKTLKKFCDNQLEGRVTRMRMFVKNLKNLGFKITEEDVLRNVPGKSIVQPHIVAALKSYPENLVLLEKFYQELAEKAKTDVVREKQLEEAVARPEQKWYVLVMSDNALHPAYAKYHSHAKISVDDAVKLIRDAGGIALLAHWSYIRDKFTLDIVEKYLQEKRLDGLETVYAFGNEAHRDLFNDDMEKLAKLCERYGLVQGGGGDFHTPEDFALMTDPTLFSLAKRTMGLWEKILDRHPQLKLTRTSLSGE